MMRLGLPGGREAFGQVQTAGVLVYTMNLKERANTLLARASYDPTQGSGAVASTLELGKDFDELKPHLPVAFTQVHSPDLTVAITEDEDLVVLHNRREEGTLLVLVPRTVCPLNQLHVRLLMQLEQPLVVFLGGEAHLQN